MKMILAFRNISAALFFGAVFFSGAETNATARACGPLNLNWTLNGCPTQEDCLLETIDLAAENDGAGNGCQDTCEVGCNSSWIYGDLYRSNNCNIGGSGWYDSGTVGCYCENTPGGF